MQTIATFAEVRLKDLQLRSAGALSSKIVLVSTLALLTGAAGQNSKQKFTAKKLPLPGASGVVMLDYTAYDQSRHQLWVPPKGRGALWLAQTEMLTSSILPEEVS